jgi:MATE family multidrug resistance protein
MPAAPDTPDSAETTGAAPSPPRTLTGQIRRTLGLALPVMAARAGLILMITVDSIMAGQASAEALAHYGISMAPHVFLLVVGIGLLVGTVVLVGQADGAGRPRDCGRAWHAGLVLAAIVGTLFGGVLLFGETILLTLGQSPGMAEGGGRALAMFGVGLPALLMFAATGFFLEGLGRPRTVMLIALAANLPNAALNWLLIEGNLGLPAMGAAGATLATSLTRWGMLALLLALVLRLPDGERYAVRAFAEFRLATLKRLLRLGAPLALATGLEASSFTSYATFAGWLGEQQMAAWQSCINVISFAFMLAIGMSTATTVRVANAVGRDDRHGVALAGWLGFGLIAVLMAAIGLVIAGFNGTVAGFYSDSPEVRALAAGGLLIAAVILVFDGAQGVLMGAHRGLGDVLVPTGLQGLSFWGVGVPTAYALGVAGDLGFVGLLLGLLAGMVTSSTLLTIRFRIASRRALRPL